MCLLKNSMGGYMSEQTCSQSHSRRETGRSFLTPTQTRQECAVVLWMNKSNAVNSLRWTGAKVGRELADRASKIITLQVRSQQKVWLISKREHFCPPDRRHQSSPARRGGHLRLKGKKKLQRQVGLGRSGTAAEAALCLHNNGEPLQRRLLSAEGYQGRFLPHCEPSE